MPIGTSRVVTGGVSRVGINCAFCHTGRVRLRPGDLSTIVPGAPGHQVNWDRYRRFLIACAFDPRFTSETLLAEIDRNYQLPMFERMLYKWALIPRARRTLRELATAESSDSHEIGAGRSAPFGVGMLPPAGGPSDAFRAASDIMPVWNLGRPREAFYWDGINTKLSEVMTAWALASGSPARWIDRDQRGRRLRCGCVQPRPHSELSERAGAAEVSAPRRPGPGEVGRGHLRRRVRVVSRNRWGADRHRDFTRATRHRPRQGRRVGPRCGSRVQRRIPREGLGVLVVQKDERLRRPTAGGTLDPRTVPAQRVGALARRSPESAGATAETVSGAATMCSIPPPSGSCPRAPRPSAPARITTRRCRATATAATRSARNSSRIASVPSSNI